MNIIKSLKVILVDFLGLLIGVFNGFLLPKYLDINGYAYLKTFTLYTSYAGMFHFGFSDGIYILLGGKNISNIKKEKIKGYFYTLLKIVCLVLPLLLIISFFYFTDIAFKYFIIYIIPFQIVLFISLLYRATGEFDKYIIIKIAINLLNLVSTVAVMLIAKSPLSYMNIQVGGYILIALTCSSLFITATKKAEIATLSEIKRIISIGFSVMIANTVNNLFLSLDRWFVKVKFSVEDFAYYSFAVSMLSLFLTLMNSLTILFYPYLARNKHNNNVIINMKTLILLISSFAPACYFILDFIVRSFIGKYIMSLEILGILIICIPFLSMINILYLNLYKAYNRGKEYLFVASKMVVLSFVINFFIASIFKNPTLIAYGLLITLVVWYIYSSKDFTGLRLQKKEVLYFVNYFLIYYILKDASIYSLIKSLIFIIINSVMEYAFLKNELKEIAKMIFDKKSNIIEME